MTKLSDTQTILLSSAAQRADRSLLPLPASLKPGGGATKALAALLSRDLIEERETNDAAAARRVDGERRFGLYLTGAGAAAIGVVLPDDDAPAANGGAGTDTTTSVPISATPSDKAPRKTDRVLDLLRRPTGATLAELIAATGWLPHTTRAALTGLRKKGHAITRGARDGVTCYTVVIQGTGQ